MKGKIFIALYLWYNVAIQYLSVNPDWVVIYGIIIFVYYVGVWGCYFATSVEAPKKTCNYL